MNAFWEIVASNAVLVVILAAVITVVGRFWKNPQALHLLWLFVLLKFITPPLLTVPIHLPSRPIAVEAKHTAAPSPDTEAAFPVDEKAADSEPRLARPSFDQEPIVGADKAADAPSQPPIPWLGILAGLWGIGIVGTGFWQAFRIRRFHRLLHSAQPATGDVLSMVAEVGKQLGLRRIPRVRMLPVRVSPMVLSVGFWPQLLLPMELFERLETTAQRSLVAHELAHIRRKDHLVRLLELLVTTLFWWHPMVWWACWELQNLEDLCCDAMVVGIMSESKKVYATALMNTLDFLCDGSIAAPLGITATQSSVLLTRRIAMLKNHSGVMRLTLGRIVVLLLLAVVPMSIAFAAKPPKGDESNSANAGATVVIPSQDNTADSVAASPDPASPKANDESDKPADEVSPASDQSATKEGTEKTKGVTWKWTVYLRSTSKDGKKTWLTTETRQKAFKAPGLYRETFLDEKGQVSEVQITDALHKKQLKIFPRTKEANLSEIATDWDPSGPFGWVKKELEDPSLQWVETRKTAAGDVNIFRLARRDQANGRDWSNDFWIDKKTKQLVEIHSPGADIYDPDKDPARNTPPEKQWSQTAPGSFDHDIAFEAALDESLFRLEPPEGYTVKIQRLGQVTEKEMIDFLGIMADFNDKTFPDQPFISSDRMNKVWAKPEKDRTAAEQKLLETEDTYKIKFLRHPIGLFIEDHAVENSFRYLGNGVKLGEKDRIVCWYKLKGAKAYRVVYGDLSVKDIDPKNLPLPVQNGEIDIHRLLDNPGARDSTSSIPSQGKSAESPASTPAPAPTKANDQSGKTSTAKPAGEVSPANDQSATKKVAEAKYEAARARAEDDIDVRYAIAAAAVAKAAYKLSKEKVPGSVPLERLNELLLRCKEADLAVEKARHDQRIAVEEAKFAKAEFEAAKLRKEVREGRSFNPDEFAIALEQVVAGTAPDDYKKPEQFFSRTCFTRALRENSGLVLRRLAGKTENTAPVQTLVTQMGGGKTHMETTLWHLANTGPAASAFPGVADLLKEANLTEVPSAKVAVFVGNAWDPQPGRETPWIDIARQLAGDAGVAILGPSAKDAPPGTDTINRLIAKVDGPVLLLFDELLNLFSRHRGLGEPMHAFLHNIVRGFVGSNHRAAVISLPRSQVEMTDWDLQWQDKIIKVIGAVAKPLLVNDEGEISEVIRRRLFENLGSEKTRKNVARAFADWCFERRAQLPPEWTAVDTSTTEKKAKEFLQARFEACYPFHPAALSVFQRKWQTLPQYQQTRGTLAMLAQWISKAVEDGYKLARREPLITLGSAPLDVPEFRSVVLGQLGESRLLAAIDTDIAGERSHARTLDADTTGVLRDIHRRVGTTILFESSGGQVNKVAHLPELRFALGEPEVDTTSVDTAAASLEAKAFFIQRVGADGFKVFHKAKIDKAVHDRRASLDEEDEVKPMIRTLVKEEIKRGASIPVEPFPADSSTVPDSPRLNLVVLDPTCEWDGGDTIRNQVAEWTKNRGKSSRLYPGALVWCVRKPGRDLRDKVELLLAWRRVQKDVRDGLLGADFERADHQEIQVKVAEAEDDAKDEVWAGYRFVVLADSTDPSGLKVIDLGAGHSSASETLCGRIIAALKAEALLNESVGAGYIDRNWPPAFKDSGAWPLASLRQSFLNGALTRLLDPDTVLKTKLVEFVGRGDFGLGSGGKPDGSYERLWFREVVQADEVAFEAGVVLLKKGKADELKKKPVHEPGGTGPSPEPQPPGPVTVPVVPPEPGPEPDPLPPTKTPIRVSGTMPAELWNRFGTRVLPKLRAGEGLRIVIDLTATFDGSAANDAKSDLRQVLRDLGLDGSINIE